MKYIQPTMNVVKLQHSTVLLQGSPVTSVRGNADLKYGGGNSSQEARVKQDSYDVWDDDWDK